MGRLVVVFFGGEWLPTRISELVETRDPGFGPGAGGRGFSLADSALVADLVFVLEEDGLDICSFAFPLSSSATMRSLLACLLGELSATSTSEVSRSPSFRLGPGASGGGCSLAIVFSVGEVSPITVSEVAETCDLSIRAGAGGTSCSLAGACRETGLDLALDDDGLAVGSLAFP